MSGAMVMTLEDLVEVYALCDLAGVGRQGRNTGFTDRLLSIPDRCTRSEGGEAHNDPWRDFFGAIIGDELLVDVSAYNGSFPGPVWCKLTGVAPGSASVYPYKVAVPDRGTGQFKPEEVLAVRRPLWLHRVVRENVKTSRLTA